MQFASEAGTPEQVGDTVGKQAPPRVDVPPVSITQVSPGLHWVGLAGLHSTRQTGLAISTATQMSAGMQPQALQQPWVGAAGRQAPEPLESSTHS